MMYRDKAVWNEAAGTKLLNVLVLLPPGRLEIWVDSYLKTTNTIQILYWLLEEQHSFITNDVIGL